MTDTEFLDIAESTLKAIETCCDRINVESDLDLDIQRNGNVVTLIFVDRSQIVVNLQKPLQEIWLASKDGGYHFRWKQGQWQDTRGRGDFFSMLSSSASAHARQSVTFTDLSF